VYVDCGPSTTASRPIWLRFIEKRTSRHRQEPVKLTATVLLMQKVDEKALQAEPQKQALFVIGESPQLLELALTSARVNHLEDVIPQFDGSRTGNAGIPTSHMMSLQEVVETVQGSKAEVLAALKDQKIMVTEDEKVCILKPGYMNEVLDMILCLVTERIDDGWPSAIPWQTCVSELKDQYPVEVIQHVLQSHCKEADKMKGKWILDMSMIATFRAHQLFSKKKKWAKSDFLRAWAQAMPTISIDPPSDELLTGIALQEDKKGTEVDYLYFAAESLPRNADACFEKIFDMKTSWNLSTLEPYMRHLVTPDLSQAQLLLKYTRSSVAIGSSERVYSRRR